MEVTIVLVLIYCSGLVYLFKVKPRLPKYNVGKTHKYSIIIPARNEETQLPTLFDSLKLLKGNFEVLLVDDNSSDKTLAMMNAFKSEVSFDVKVLSLIRFGKSPKKAAITLAMDYCNGEIIVTTDADCTVPKNWLEVLDRYFSDKDVKMVTGGVYFSATNTFLKKMQALELSALLFVSSKMLHLNKPFTCNGANLAYRKEVFEEVHGFVGVDHIASGDDELLMKKIYNEHPSGVFFQSEAWVETMAQDTWQALCHQRIRWASKWKFSSSKDKLLGGFLALMYLNIVVAVVFYPLNGFLLGTLFLKFVVDSFTTFFSWKERAAIGYPLLYNIPLFLMYPFYSLLIGILSNFIRYNWKGRSLN